MNNDSKDQDFVPFDDPSNFDDLDEYQSEYDDQDQEKDLNDVRGESELAKQKKLQKKGQKALLFLLFAAAGLIALAMIYYFIQSFSSDDAQQTDETQANFERPSQRDFGKQYLEEEVDDYDPLAAAEETELTPVEDTSGIAGNVPESPDPVYVEPMVEPRYEPEPEPRYEAPLVVEERQPTPEEVREQRIYQAGFSLPSDSSSDRSENMGVAQGNNDDPLVRQLRPASLDGTSAVRMQNRDLIITKGNMVDCVLDTKFDSTVVGMVSCTVTRNVYGASGRVVLIDRGSRVTGEYKGGLQHGQNRVFILWNRVETPGGVIIDINSPATGSLGEAGVAGRVDNKFWQRFGGAMLVSLIDDFGKALSEAAAEKAIGGNVTLENSSDTAKEMSKSTLEQMINIPPSLIKHQGDRVGIYVARDIWFGDVYKLQPKQPKGGSKQ